MYYFNYDRTFEGLLTCVFDAYNRKQFPHKIQPYGSEIPLFTESIHIITDPEKANRVFNALKKKLSSSAIEMLFICFLAENEGLEMIIFRYIQKSLDSDKNIELNFADQDVLELSKIYKRVADEANRMKQFVRFQKTADDIFFASLEPRYDVLPLVVDFFEDRFADQRWILYDLIRNYGLYYDLNKTEEVHFDNLEVSRENGKLAANLLNSEEIDFQQLWKSYIKSTTIRERINLKLQRQHMPKRFWRFLTEKQ